jgi:hypothetical protein
VEYISGRMEARDRKKVKLEFHAASSSKGVAMKKLEVHVKVTSSQTKLIVDQNLG